MNYYCPKCNGVNIRRTKHTRPPNTNRMSMDERASYSGFVIQIPVHKLDTYTLVCEDCGYSVEYKE